jgi:DNA polymerase-3 subunit delta
MYRLYHGKSPYLSLREAHRLLDTELKENEIISIDADSQDPLKIIDLLYSPSLFTTPRVYFLKRVYKNKNKDILLENLLEILKTDQITVIIWEDQKIRSNTKYYKFFKKNNSVEELKDLNRRTFITWAKKELEKSKITLSYDLLNTLCQRSNYDPQRFLNNLNKLELLDEEIINIKILDQVVANTLESDIWKLMDSITESNQTEINNILSNLLEYRVDPNYILAMIARNLRISIQTKHLLDKGINTRKFPSILKLPPFAVYPMIKSVESTKKEKILMQYRKLSNLDYEIKTGRIDPILGLSLFTLVL